jgi:hypothetical protein
VGVQKVSPILSYHNGLCFRARYQSFLWARETAISRDRWLVVVTDESGPGGIGFMVSPMHRLRSLASAPEFRCKLSTVLRRTPQTKAQSPQKSSP